MIGFLEFISHVRIKGEIILETSMPKILARDIEEVEAFLQSEYESECLEYPAQAPIFCKNSAIWAAKLLMQASFCFLNRKQNLQELVAEFHLLQTPLEPEKQLSADLCLRFLPQLIGEFILVDAEDPIILTLEDQIKKCPITAILHFEDFEINNINSLSHDNCVELLAIDRIVQHKRFNWLKNNILGFKALSYSGLYAKHFLETENKFLFI